MLSELTEGNKPTPYRPISESLKKENP